MRKSNFVFDATMGTIAFNAFARLSMVPVDGIFQPLLIGALQGITLLIGFSFLFNVIEELRRSK